MRFMNKLKTFAKFKYKRLLKFIALAFFPYSCCLGSLYFSVLINWSQVTIKG